MLRHCSNCHEYYPVSVLSSLFPYFLQYSYSQRVNPLSWVLNINYPFLLVLQLILEYLTQECSQSILDLMNTYFHWVFVMIYQISFFTNHLSLLTSQTLSLNFLMNSSQFLWFVLSKEALSDCLHFVLQ